MGLLQEIERSLCKAGVLADVLREQFQGLAMRVVCMCQY
jgi:hypothetical protein